MFVENIVYRGDSDRGVLDIMAPDTGGPFPFVMCIHGGAWSGGDKSYLYPYGEELTKLGIASVFPNYRLTGTDSHPAQEEDLFAALRWVAENSETYKLDPKRVGITGCSAGGHLAALIGLKATKRTGLNYSIRCMVPVCPPTDFSLFLRDSPSIRPVLEALVGGPMEENQDVVRDLSPVCHIHKNAPPCLVTHGDADTVVPPSQATSFIAALRAQGVVADVILVPGVDHAAFTPESDPPEPLGGITAFKEFFRTHLLQ